MRQSVTICIYFSVISKGTLGGNRAWDALSPDPFLNPMKYDFQWLTRVFESVKPTDGRGGLIWASLGAKTLELVHENLQVGEVHDEWKFLRWRQI